MSSVEEKYDGSVAEVIKEAITLVNDEKVFPKDIESYVHFSVRKLKEQNSSIVKQLGKRMDFQTGK